MANLSEPFFPNVTEVTDPEDEREREMLVRCLESRIRTRDLLRKDIEDKENNFRNILVEMIRENESLKNCNGEQKKTISMLEGRICKLQNNIDCLLYKLNSACDAVRNLQEELRIRERQLKQYSAEKEKITQRYHSKLQEETDKVAEEFESKLRVQREQFENCIERKNNKLQLVKQILTATTDKAPILMAASSIGKRQATIAKTPAKFMENSPVMTPVEPQVIERQTSDINAISSSDDASEGPAQEKIIPTTSKGKLFTKTSDLKADVAEESVPVTDSQSPSELCSDNVATAAIKSETKPIIERIPITNPRYRSHFPKKWIDHRPAGTIPTGTIMQPQTQQRPIRKLTSPRPFITKSARYCLLAQEQDTDGELETKLYKANVLPTCGGGAQIVFNDIERLRQESLTAAKQIENKSSK